MDIDQSMGGLLLAAGTHKKDLGADAYRLEMPSRTPYLPDSVADGVWLRTDFHPGDVLDLPRAHRSQGAPERFQQGAPVGGLPLQPGWGPDGTSR